MISAATDVFCVDLSDNSSEDEAGGDGTTNENPLDLLHDKVMELTAAYELVVKNSSKIFELEDSVNKGGNFAGNLKERLSLFKVTASAMITASILQMCNTIQLH